MTKKFVLAAAIAISTSVLPLLSEAVAQSPVFVPPNHARESQGGEHYDTVVANYIRRCTSLASQFDRHRALIGDTATMREAVTLRDQGVAHCSGGARLQGIDELTAAIRQIGGIPRVEL